MISENGMLRVLLSLWALLGPSSADFLERMNRDDTLDPQTSLVSKCGHRLMMQGDGNLVLYWHSGQAYWDTGTRDPGATHLILQFDRNLVAYGPNGYLWASHTEGISDDSTHLKLETDGNLVLYHQGTPLWQSNTKVGCGGDYDECAAGVDDCHAQATCTNQYQTGYSCACNNGYTGSGTSCSLQNGYCPALHAPTSGTLSSNCVDDNASPRRLGGVCSNFACHYGYSLSGSSSRSCLSSSQSAGTWSGSTASCNRIDAYCTLPDPPSGGARGTCDRYLNGYCSFSCGASYFLTSGSLTHQCAASTQTTGVWNGANPVCTLCSSNCAACASGSACATCENGFALEGGKCVTCTTGYEYVSATQPCRDINACSPDPCPDNADCADQTPPSLEATCTCRQGYTLEGALCVNVVECDDPALVAAVCLPESRCIDVDGGFSCASVLVDASIQGTGTSPSPLGGLDLSDHAGGQTVQVSIKPGVLASAPADPRVVTAVVSVSVFLGPPDNPTEHFCGNLDAGSNTALADPTTSPFLTPACAVPAAEGTGWAYTVRSCAPASNGATTVVPPTDTSPRCVDSGDSVGNTFHYPRPLISTETLGKSLQGRPPAGTNPALIFAESVLSALYYFDGVNFIPDEARMQVYFGPVGSELQYRCLLDEEVTTTTVVACTSEAGAEGDNVFTVVTRDSNHTGVDVLRYPDSPKIYSVRSPGCTNDPPGPAGTVTGCPSSGQVSLIIDGSNFLAPVAVFVEGQACAMQSRNDSQIICLLPPGSGLLQSVLVSAEILGLPQFSRPALVVSFTPPSITALRGCDQPAGGPGGTDVTALTGCSRDGGGVLYVQGTNFGESGATIQVGALPCSGVVHDALRPHELLSCTLAPASGQNVNVMVSQGGLSKEQASVSFAECFPGSIHVGTACVECDPGKYMASHGQSSCLHCDAGRFARLPGNHACELCPAGRFSAPVPVNQSMPLPNRTFCEPCAEGYYTDAAGQDSCLQCPRGRASDQPATGLCPQCDPGRSAGSSGLLQCTPCEAGRFASLPGQEYCDTCAPGSVPSLNHSACQPCTPGRFANANFTCEACQPGTIAAGHSAVACTPCEAGRIAALGEAWQCVDCDSGTYADESAASHCRNCSAGSYAVGRGNAACLRCEGGRFAVESGQSECADCEEGRYAPLVDPDAIPSRPFNATRCLACQPGRFASLPGSETCPLCDPGRASFGNASCSVCLPGHYAGSSGISQCVPCQVGTFVSNPGQDRCTPCLAGSFANVTASVVCVACPAGTAREKAGATTCLDCSAGRHASGDGEVWCPLCPAGRIAPDNATVTCTDCLPGEFQSNSGSTACARCKAGTFSSGRSEVCTPCVGSVSGEGASICIPCVTPAVPDATHTYCVCPRYSFWRGVGKGCAPCPTGAACDEPGVLVETIGSSLGHWRSMQGTFFECVSGTSCLGGVNSTCMATAHGPLCGICVPGSSRSSNRFPCQMCPGEAQNILVSIGLTVLILACVGVLYVVLLRGDANNLKLLAEADDPTLSPGSSGLDKSTGPVKDRSGSDLRSMSTLAVVLTDDRLEQRFKADSSSDRAFSLKIMVGFFQVMTALTDVVSARWPSYFKQMLSAFSFINLDFIPWNSLGCLFDINYFHKVVIATASAPALLVILAAGALPLYCRMRHDMSDSQTSGRNVRTFVRRYLKLCLFTLFLVYPKISSLVLSTFRCVEIDGVRFLYEDLSLRCDAQWESFLIYNIVVVVIYPLGVPLLFMLLIWLHRHKLDDPAVEIFIGFLYNGYTKRTRITAEALDVLHKMLLCSLIQFFHPRLQIQVGMIVACAYLIVLLLRAQYRTRTDDTLHIFVQVAIIHFLLVGHVIATLGRMDETMDILLSIMLITWICIIFVLFGGLLVIKFKGKLQNLRKKQAFATYFEDSKAIEDEELPDASGLQAE